MHKQAEKTTRVRTVLNEKQLHTLRTCYAANPRPDALMKEQLVEMTGLSPRVIRVWFQNKRCKDKKKSILMKQLQQQQHSDKAVRCWWRREGGWKPPRLSKASFWGELGGAGLPTYLGARTLGERLTLAFKSRWLSVVPCASDSPELRGPQLRVDPVGWLGLRGCTFFEGRGGNRAGSEFLFVLFCFVSHTWLGISVSLAWNLTPRSEPGSRFVGPGVSPLQNEDSLCAVECVSSSRQFSSQLALQNLGLCTPKWCKS